MTLLDAISQVNELTPNGYSQKQKIVWLSRVDAMTKQFIDSHENGSEMGFSSYTENTPLDTVLLIPEPYDEAYIHWLEAQIHYANDDIDSYNNAISMFYTAFDGYKDFYRKRHTPKGLRRFLF